MAHRFYLFSRGVSVRLNALCSVMHSKDRQLSKPEPHDNEVENIYIDFQPKGLKAIIRNQNRVRSKYKNLWNILEPAKPYRDRRHTETMFCLGKKQMTVKMGKIKTKGETECVPKWEQNRTLIAETFPSIDAVWELHRENTSKAWGY